jgi:hypothetical protein
MKLVITDTTDKQHLGLIIEDVFPFKFEEFEFVPDGPPIKLDDGCRYFNSNYSIDTKEI